MQEKSAQNEHSIIRRLTVLRHSLMVSWGELATELGISRSMLVFLKNGKRFPSAKLWRRIVELELKCGIPNKTENCASNVSTLNTCIKDESSKLTVTYEWKTNVDLLRMSAAELYQLILSLISEMKQAKGHTVYSLGEVVIQATYELMARSESVLKTHRDFLRNIISENDRKC